MSVYVCVLFTLSIQSDIIIRRGNDVCVCVWHLLRVCSLHALYTVCIAVPFCHVYVCKLSICPFCVCVCKFPVWFFCVSVSCCMLSLHHMCETRLPLSVLAVQCVHVTACMFHSLHLFVTHTSRLCVCVCVFMRTCR